MNEVPKIEHDFPRNIVDRKDSIHVWTRVCRWCIGGCFLLLVAFLLFMPAVQQAGARPRSPCKNNLKHIGFALHDYHEVHGSFPPAYLVDENGRPMHSWRVLILPFLGEEKLYDRYRLDEPWDSPHNSSLAGEIPEYYRCQQYNEYCKKHKLTEPPLSYLTNYLAIRHPDGVFDGTRATSFDDITDGSSNTLMVIETKPHAVHWMQPEDITLPEILTDLELARHKGQSNHLGGVNALIADGSVHFIGPDILPKLLRDLVTRDGGEDVTEGW